MQLINISGSQPEYKTPPFKACNHSVARICFNATGTLVAVTSTIGTLIRVFDARTGTMLATFRRGSTPCSVCSIAFSPSDAKLAVLSESGTVHVFALRAVLVEGKPDTEYSGDGFHTLDSLTQKVGLCALVPVQPSVTGMPADPNTLTVQCVLEDCSMYTFRVQDGAPPVDEPETYHRFYKASRSIIDIMLRDEAKPPAADDEAFVVVDPVPK